MKRPEADDDDDLAARIVSTLKIGAPLAVVLLAIGVGVVRGAPLAILVLAAGALAAVIALFWQSVRTLVGETPLSGADAFAIAAPRAEEEKKRAVLRALKDLEFERSVGKISEADYDQLVLSYRAQARSLLQQLDESAKPRRDRVMELVDERLRRAGLAGGIDEARAVSSISDEKSDPKSEQKATEQPAEEPPARKSGPKSDPKSERTATQQPTDDDATDDDATDDATDDDATDDATDEAPARATCAACAASNEPDAAFCKKCGAKMDAPTAEVDADAT